MKTSLVVLYLFLLLSIVFVTGSIFDFKVLTSGATYFLIPTLLLYYRFKTRKWFLPMVIALLLFYVRDIFLLYGFQEYPAVVISTFAAGLFILYLCAILGFQKSKVHFVEILSLTIMYGFLGFLFFTLGELVPQVMPSYKWATYSYLLLLTVLLAITFTQYLLKSHYASLWLMLAAASLLVSELSLFFKMYVLPDISVTVFFPLFHVLAYYAMVEHALNRRRTSIISGF